ncbi:esterase-like activity of phytase family protein [Synechococcus sp. MIT S9452]|uniref:esterase-like activity of phytase family protein n=1 Tax=Synechococcus sp. MIT S9452 TaxID=3082546 RepID=UPI0039A5F743
MIPVLAPCPLEAGWELIWQQSLPKSAADQRLGGFSGMALDWPRRRLLLLSDAKRTHSLALHWDGTVRQSLFSVQAPRPLQGQGSQKLDGEALVRLPGTAPRRFWMVSEARNPSKRPASLLELKLLGSGGFAIQQQWPLPAEWQPQQGRGLKRNKGPEALVPLPGMRFVLAAEASLQQDSPRQLRLLLAQQQGQQMQFTPLGTSLLVSAPLVAQPHWGLTALLPAQAGAQPPLLALWRGYAEPNQWWNRLSLLPPLPLDQRPRRALAPLMRWDLRDVGLEPDNWEALTAGPQLEDGRPTLLLASDDNFSPFQQNRLALLAPLQPEPCASADSR